jgi:hypothetical protein
MDLRVVLSKVVALIYRSRLINNLDNDDLIRTILQTIRSDAPEVLTGGNILKKLKELCVELLDEKEFIAKEVLLPRIHLILDTDQKLYTVIKESIDPDYEDTTNKRVCTSLIKALNSYYREHLASEMLGKASYDLKFNRAKIPNFSEYLRDLHEKIEPLTTHSNSIKDPAIMNEVDFESQESVEKVFEEMRVNSLDDGVYKFGWQDMNVLAQGGIRRGETMTIAALQHKYKSGYVRSIFTQIAKHNSPVVYAGEEGKKPLLLYISFEDPTATNVQFIYQYLKANEGVRISKRELQEIPIKEAAAYVKEQLTATGFHIKMLRVDPTQWDFRAVMNKVIEFEAQGYSLHLLLLDYITMLPTTGCQTGPIGYDRKELLRRLKNFCVARKAAFITPIQLSSEAKQLLRNGTPDHQFVKEIAEKGYYDGTKTIDQEIDLEVFIHLFTQKRKKYLTVMRGKHRLTTNINDEEKYFILPFMDINTPILEDLNKDKISFRTMPKDFGGAENADMVNEIFG